MIHSYADIADRIHQLRNSHSIYERQRIRATLNGGAEGVQAVLAWGSNDQQNNNGSQNRPNAGFAVDLPTANMMASGLERMAQTVGRMPTLKTDMIPTNDTPDARKSAEKRLRIVRGWDEVSRFELQFPQIGRWLPGYGFTFHTMRERNIGGQTIPVAELRDPYDVFPGQWGVDQQPADVCVVRQMSHDLVAKAYPHAAEALNAGRGRGGRGERFGGVGVVILGQASGWEGQTHRPVEVVEYYNADGTYVCIPEIELICAHIPNPLSEPAFVLTKRFSFDKLQSHYAHVFGLMAMMAKLNILGLIAAEDSVFKETNVFGNLVGKTYKRGRKAVNQFEPGARVEKPTSDQLNQTWQAVNILERQFRNGAGYDVSQDGQSPNSYATGAAVKELGGSADNNVREYQTAIKHTVELIDRKRLEWEAVLHAKEKKTIHWFQSDGAYKEEYVPEKDIAGNLQTRRVYGAMATFDDNMKVVTGLQLMQAGVLDRRSMMDAMDNNDSDVSLMLERMDEDKLKELLLSALGERAMQQDPAAMLALTEMFEKPGEIQKILIKFFTPQEPQMSPEEQAMMQGQGQPGMGGPPQQMGPPPPVQTVLSQIEAENGGVMSVGQMR